MGASEDDYVGTFEKAASRNFLDAERLRRGNRSLGAIYHYGYCVEMLVKAAYFRMAFPVAQPPLPLATTRIDSGRRRQAVRETDAQGNRLVPNDFGPHDFKNWALLLTRKRALLAATDPVVVYDPALANEIRDRADRVYGYWKEYIRYRSFPVRAGELAIVRGDADWFRRNYPSL